MKLQGSAPRRTRRRIGIVVFAAAVAVVAGSAAWACVPVIGSTFYDDGSRSKTGVSNVALSAFALGASPGVQYYLVSGTNPNAPNHDGHACMEQFVTMNPAVRIPNSRGFIPTTGGTMNRIPGEWEICFRSHGGSTSTSAAIYTVI